MSEPNALVSVSGVTEEIKEELLSIFCEALGRPDFKAKEGFLDSGGDSLTVVETILEIEKQYGVTLSAAEFMALDTAESLARRIVSSMKENGSKSGTEPASTADQRTMLSVVQEGERAHPLVCAYGINGEAAYAITAAAWFPTEQPVAALQIRADELKGDEGRSLRALAKSDAEKILQQYPHRSCILMGYSLGAHVALAVGHELTKRGSPPALIAVLDDEADLDSRHYGAVYGTKSTTSIRGTLKAALKCSPAEPIATRLVYFRSAENDAYYRSDPTCGWGEIATGGVKYYDLPFNHGQFVHERSLRQIAPLLLEEISTPSPVAPRPCKTQILRFQARCAAREGDLSKELSILKQVIVSEKDQPAWVYANLAEGLFQMGDTTAALAALSKARLHENWQLSLDLRFLPEFQKPGLEAERADVLLRLAALEADHPSVNEQKARAYFRLGLHNECERELRAGLAMQPSHLRLSRLLVRYLNSIEAWPELITTAERLVQHHPGVTHFRTNLILAYLKTGSPAQALQFRDAIMAQAEPGFQELLVLGEALFRCDSIAEALDLAELAATMEPSRPRAHSLRSKCLQSMGLQAEAAAARRLANNLRHNKTGMSPANSRSSNAQGGLANVSKRLLRTLLFRS